MLNLYRIFYYQVTPGAKLPKRVIERVRELGYIEFKNEIFAIVNNANIMLTSAKGKPSVEADKRALAKIKATRGYNRVTKDRRKVMSLHIASSFKQTLQVNTLMNYERGIDMVHREVLDIMMPY
jgi:hypothetical protein